jgi:hypothetical protein
MTILNILKTKPDDVTQALMDSITEGEEATRFNLYEGPVDYEKLIDLIFKNDKTVSWW